VPVFSVDVNTCKITFADQRNAPREPVVRSAVVVEEDLMDNLTRAMPSIAATLEEKSAECAREARKQAALLPPGPVRDALLQKAKEYEAEIPEDETYE
jgi:hypothetical protein